MNRAKITKQASIYIRLQFLIIMKTTPASPLPSHLVPGMDAILSPWNVVRKEGPREHLPGLMLAHTSTMSHNQSLRQVGICFSPSRGQRHEASCPSRVLSIALHSCQPRCGPQGRNLTARNAVLSQKSEGCRGPNVLTPCSAACPLQGWLTDPEFQQLLVIHMSERAQGPCRGT